MKKIQENRLSMYIFVNETCNNYQSVWNGVKLFADAKKEFEQGIQNILDHQKQQAINTSGITKNKNILAEKLIEITLEYISILKVYAVMNSDEKLMGKISFSKSQLLKKRDTIMFNTCHFIYECATNANKTLIKYGMAEEKLVDFGAALQNYHATLSDTIEARKYKKMATDDLFESFAQISAILKNRMDNLMVLFKDTHKVFYTAYFNSRKVEKRGLRHTKNQAA